MSSPRDKEPNKKRKPNVERGPKRQKPQPKKAVAKSRPERPKTPVVSKKVVKEEQKKAANLNFLSRFKKLHQDVYTSFSNIAREKPKSQKKKAKDPEAEQIDLLIGDHRLLRSNPIQAVRDIRQSGHGFSLPTIFVTVTIVIVVAVMILLALYRLQIKEHESIKAEAARQYYSRTVDLPKRGEIYDRNGFKLASTTYLYRVGITPKHLYSRTKEVKEEEIIEALASFLDLPVAEVQAAAAKTEATYVQLKKDIDYERGQALEAYVVENQIGGIRLDPEPRRSYFNEDLASQVIGFTSSEGQHLSGRLGIELSYDELLSGDSGYSYGARMNYANSGAIPFTRSSQIEKKEGANLYLTLDMNVQKILQERLAEACKKYAATEDGMAIAMDPYTGEIYGMASYPYFKSSDPTGAPSKFTKEAWEKFRFDNLKDYQTPAYPAEDGQEVSQADLAAWDLAQRKIHYLSSQVWRNKAVSDVYEAGSTFKAITAAIGLEEAVTNEQQSYNDAKIQVLDYFISCYSGEEGHGYVSLETGFALSCNPVFVQVALATGIEKFYDYVEAFGFREPTGIELPAEANCIFHQQPSLIDLATLSFGEQSPVTAIHMMRAYAAIVNGGKLVKPTIIKEVRSRDGRLLSEAAVEVEREVISEQTSARLRELLKKMVESSANYTNAGGYIVGGKTSTSVDEATGYTTVSFMEAAPIDHPRLLVMFVIQKPENPAIGGVEAQVTTMEATSEILEYLNIDRELSLPELQQAIVPTTMPGIIGMTYEQAADKLKWLRIPIRMGSAKMDKNSIISAQIPSEGNVIFPGNVAYAFVESVPQVVMTKLPDFTGKNAFECINEANRAGLIVNFEGDINGLCFAQKAVYILPTDPTASENIVEIPGQELPRGSVVQIALGGEGGLANE